MLFTSATFLFLFLPATLLLYFAARSLAWRNAILLFASVFFYVWGEMRYCWLIGVLIGLNYTFALVLQRLRGRPAASWILAAAIGLNLLALVRFKYGAFIADNWAKFAQFVSEQCLHLVDSNAHLPLLAIKDVALPLGISFFVFHCISYLVDIHRGNASAQKNPITMALYIGLFPQLIAGPIIRYSEICDQFTQRLHTSEAFARGIQRFIIGLGKKLILANAFAVPADAIFALPPDQLSTGVAWLGAVSYTLQLYFDFCGYSDMAIGLGLIFGFRFPENFSYPYIAQSVREFWQRWHMSLSAWFRDYVYVPLGGNRSGSFNTALNLLIVFFLCGLWHGANWTFVIWGLFHGTFLSLERVGMGALLTRLWAPLRTIYTLLVVIVGWVFFRSESVSNAMAFISAMFGMRTGVASTAAQATISAGNGNALAGAVSSSNALAAAGSRPVPIPEVADFLNSELCLLFAVGVIAATPLLREGVLRLSSLAPRGLGAALSATRVAWLIAILFVSITEIHSGSYNPFIYFHF